MTIYVDHLRPYYQKAKSGQRWFGEGKESCHLATDGSLEELHAFAKKLGLPKKYFQDHRRFPHYDLTPKKQEQAITLGAKLITSEELILKCDVKNIQKSLDL